MTQSLATREPRYTPTPIGTERLGAIFVASGLFEGTRNDAQAITRIMLGAEMGFGPVASMLGVYVVNGRPSASGQLIAAAIQKSGVFRYRVREWTDTLCRIEFFEGGESLGVSTFGQADAERAALWTKDIWKKYPKAMLWARAMSQGARAYTPSVFNGAIYTPEELGAEVDNEGRVIDVEPDPEPVVVALPKQQKRERSLDELVQAYQQRVDEANTLELVPDEDLDSWVLPPDATRETVIDYGKRIAEVLKLAQQVRVGDPLSDALAAAIFDAQRKDVEWEDCRVELPAPRLKVEHALRILTERLNA